MKPIVNTWEINKYLARNSSGPVEGLPDPDPDLFLSVVIPAYKEVKLADSIRSLLSCTPPGKPWEILVNINYPSNADEAAVKTCMESYRDVLQLKEENLLREDVSILPFLSPDIPAKQAGVGLARKIGMDEAVKRFAKLSRPEGIIAGFDGDTQCSGDYLQKLFRFYQDHPKANTANVYFEHPAGNDYHVRVINAIVLYELYLRYFRLALEETGHPHAIHTVGSSFTVRAGAYVRAGGMGRQQAGEDFYFLHKCIQMGHFYEINTTALHPSPRESDRVIFGTGAAIRKQLSGPSGLDVYHLDSFEPLKWFFGCLPDIYDDSFEMESLLDHCTGKYPALSRFLTEQGAAAQLFRMKKDSASFKTFSGKFFAWFNAFRILRYVNESHKDFYHMKPIQIMAELLAGRVGIATSPDPMVLLEGYREFEKARGIRRIT